MKSQVYFFLYYQNIFQHSCAYSKGNRKETSSQSSCYLNHPRNNCHVTRNMPQVTFVFSILIPNSKSTIGHFITMWSFPPLVLYYQIQINKYLQKLFFYIYFPCLWLLECTLCFRSELHITFNMVPFGYLGPLGTFWIPFWIYTHTRGQSVACTQELLVKLFYYPFV